jgi:hypothetical protein
MRDHAAAPVCQGRRPRSTIGRSDRRRQPLDTADSLGLDRPLFAGSEEQVMNDIQAVKKLGADEIFSSYFPKTKLKIYLPPWNDPVGLRSVCRSQMRISATTEMRYDTVLKTSASSSFQKLPRRSGGSVSCGLTSLPRSGNNGGFDRGDLLAWAIIWRKETYRA